MNYKTKSFITNNDFHRLFVHSDCFDDIANKLTKKVITRIIPDNSIFQRRYSKINPIPLESTVQNKNEIIHSNHKIQISLIALILHYAGLLVGITSTDNLINLYKILDEHNDNYVFQVTFENDNARIMYSSWMVYNIFNENKIFITEAFNQNNITKIKALISRVPEIADAETMEMLTEYFQKEKPAPVEPWNTNVPPSNIS